MEVKLHHQSFICSSSTNPWPSKKPAGMLIFCRNIVYLDNTTKLWQNSKKRCYVILSSLDNGCHSLDHHKSVLRKNTVSYVTLRRKRHLLPLASADDGVAVNGSLQVSRTDVENMGNKINQSLQGEHYSDGLVQSLHDAARVFELAIKEHCSLSRISWFSAAWIGVDRNAWVKELSYQASVYSLLHAASEISSRVDGKDRDINNFVQRSLLRQSAPLESLIRDKLLAKQPEASEWFWSEQVPAVVTSFANYFEGNPHFSAAASVFRKDMSIASGNSSDVSLLGLALTCIAAITKLGPAKVSCSQFFSMVPEITGKLMDMLADLVPLRQAYQYVKDIGLQREFLSHFGPRAAACRARNDWDPEEVVFWVDLVQKQLQQAVDREKIWSRLTTSETIEVLERDLAIFGFFIALGRSTQSFLFANGYDVIGEPMEGFIRYLIGGSLLYYPQLSSISSYQLYVEVVCEELDWLPFYPGINKAQKQLHGHRSKQVGPPNADAIPQALDVCSHWIQSFIKYSKWLENPSNVKAARFLSNGHNKLMDCVGELGISRNDLKESSGAMKALDSVGSALYSLTEKESDSFNKALESVEEALVRLEKLLQELHVSSTSSEKEHLKAACSDLERIRKLKKEAEFLEASFRAKAASLQQDNDDGDSNSSEMEEQLYSRGSYRKRGNETIEKRTRVGGKPSGLWSLLTRPPKKSSLEPTALDRPEIDDIKLENEKMDVDDSESNEMHRFEVLRNELVELEKRVQKSTNQSDNEDINLTDDVENYHDEAKGDQLVHVQKKESFIDKSVEKMKETSMDVWQGTQLLAIDVAAATGLLRRSLIGDELTEKEKKAFRRTLTDLASVVPIGILMLLPVTAVGHAAMLAAIQRYVPSLIPSTYGPERLDLLRKLEKVKEIETSEVKSEDDTEELD